MTEFRGTTRDPVTISRGRTDDPKKKGQARSWRDDIRDALIVLRHCFSVLSLAMISLTGGFLVLLDFWGERHWVLGILLYVPRFVWCLPILAILPACFVFNGRAAVLLMAFLASFALIGSGYVWRSAVSEKNAQDSITLMSHNIGNPASKNAAAAVPEHLPDVLVLQEVKSMQGYKDRFPDRAAVRLQEFGLVTRFPIVESDLLDSPRWGRVPIAARYLLELGTEQQLVIYNVHLPTRRFIISGIPVGQLALATLGGGGGVGRLIRAQNQGFFEGQIELIDALIERVKQERDPVILLGDFNLPAHGYLYRRLTSEFTDAFGVTGAGFGYTFPLRENVLSSFIRPWLRIDHVFLGPGIWPVETSQHRFGTSEHLAIALRCEVARRR